MQLQKVTEQLSYIHRNKTNIQLISIQIYIFVYPFIIMKTVESAQSFVKQFSCQDLQFSKHQTQSQVSAYQKPRIFCDDYSFNQQHSESIRNRSRVYMPGSVDESQVSMGSFNELAHKYSSIYEQLKDVDTNQLMHLFLEEIEEHQKTRKKLVSSQMQLKQLQQQIIEVNQLLNKKRQSIAQLCQTESQHLNLIEHLQGQSKNGCFSAEAHFQKKYKQLQSYMNEYIASNNQAHQQFCKRLKLMKSQNVRLIEQNEELNFQLLQQNKKTQVVMSKLQRLNKSIALGKQKEVTFTIKIDNLQEQCNSLKKQNVNLKGHISTKEHFQIQLSKQNRQLSSELDFIKEKINQNQNISKDIFEKIEQQNENTVKIAKQLQKVKQQKQKLIYQNSKMLMLLQQTEREREQELKSRKSITNHFQQISTQFENLSVEMKQKMIVNQEMKQHISILKQQIEELTSQYDLLLSAFEQEKEDKEMVKSELLNLADQVRFMDQTYQKQLSQNEKIKNQLQKFWLKRQKPPTQVSLNTLGVLNAQKYQKYNCKQTQIKGSLKTIFSLEQQ